MRTTHRSRRSIPARSSFAGFRFPSDVIVLAVRWYLRFGLSYRDVEELLAERGIQADHVTIYRWVLRFTPLLADAARPCRHRVGDRWSVDETYKREPKDWRTDPSTNAADVRLAVLVAEATIGRCLAEEGYLSARELSVDLRQAAVWLAAGAQFGG